MGVDHDNASEICDNVFTSHRPSHSAARVFHWLDVEGNADDMHTARWHLQ